MKNLIRIGVALSAMAGFSALLGSQAVGASPTKSYLAVYEALNQTVTTVNVDFTVPKYKCTSLNDAVDVYTNTYDDTGASFDGGFLELACNAKMKQVITPFFEVDGTYTNATGVPIKQKNVVDLSVSCGAAGGSVTITNTTSSKFASASTPSGSSCNGVFMGNIGVSNEAGTKNLSLPSFGSVHFSGAQLNGAPLADASPAPAPVNYYEGKKNVITVGPLTDGGTAWINKQGA